jgi:hypothetical protein
MHGHPSGPAIRRMTERASSGSWGQDSMSFVRSGWSWRVGVKFDAKSVGDVAASARFCWGLRLSLDVFLTRCSGHPQRLNVATVISEQNPSPIASTINRDERVSRGGARCRTSRAGHANTLNPTDTASADGLWRSLLSAWATSACSFWQFRWLPEAELAPSETLETG